MEKGSFFFLDIQPTFHMDLHSYIGHDPIKLKNVLIFEFGPNVEFANEALKDKSDFINKNCTLENRKKKNRTDFLSFCIGGLHSSDRLECDLDTKK